MPRRGQGAAFTGKCKVQAVPGVTSAQVELVWDPLWDQSRMSEAALLKLGLMYASASVLMVRQENQGHSSEAASRTFTVLSPRAAV